MPMGSEHSQHEERQPMASLPGPLRTVTPHQIAQMIRALDSRLAGIEDDECAGEPALVYHVEMAGGRQAFALASASSLLTSIVDLYPEADTYARSSGATACGFHGPVPRRLKIDERGRS